MVWASYIAGVRVWNSLIGHACSTVGQARLRSHSPYSSVRSLLDVLFIWIRFKQEIGWYIA